MSRQTVEFLAVLIFFFFFFAVTLVETVWLNKRAGSPVGKAFAFVFATNVFTVVVGFSLSLVVFVGVPMLAFFGWFDSPTEKDWRVWAAVGAGALTPLVVSVLAKRLGLRIFKLDAAAPPWVFSTVASVVFLLVVVAPPVLFIYFALNRT